MDEQVIVLPEINQEPRADEEETTDEELKHQQAEEENELDDRVGPVRMLAPMSSFHAPDGSLRRSTVIGLSRCPNPVHLRFSEIKYGVPIVDKTRCGKLGLLCPTFLNAKSYRHKQILDSISGDVGPGQILAIIGPSGAGKTTLLDTLTNRIRPTSGSITLNGKELTPSEFRLLTALVPQNDVLVPTLTVKETLKFHADLRLPRNKDKGTGDVMHKAARKERVRQLLKQLRLEGCAHTIVGDDLMRGISGGEKRRLSIAISLLTEPGLIFLDEPTSGLDAAMAFEVMCSIRDLAASGRAVVFTIHQPRSNIFKMFDKLLLLCRGRPVYYGAADLAVSYFSDMGLDCDRFTNPADFFLDIVTAGDSTGQTEDGIIRLLDSFRPNEALPHPSSSSSPPPSSSPNASSPPFDSDSLKSSSSHHDLSSPAVAETEQDLKAAAAHYRKLRANWFQQLGALIKRDAFNQLRNPLTLRVELFQSIVTATLFGLIFLQLSDNQQGLYSREGALIFFTVSQIFTTIQSLIYTVPKEMSVFNHERDSRLYAVSAYFLSKIVTALPGLIIFPFIFSAIVYYMIGFNPGVDNFFIFVAFQIVGAIGGGCLGLTISCVACNETVAVVLAPFFAIFQVLFGGQFLNLKDVPAWGIWLPPISIPRWTFQALIRNEFLDTTWKCSPDDNPCITSGNQVIDKYDYPYFPYWAIAGFIILIGLGMLLAGYLVLAFKDWLRTRR